MLKPHLQQYLVVGCKQMTLAMDKLKNKYEIILGFVTLIISLSAFKDELSKINLELGYATITVANYLLYCVYGFSLCLYFYIIENIFRDTKVGKWKFWDYLLIIAFFLFIVILTTPIIVLLSIGLAKLSSIFSNRPEESKNVLILSLTILGTTVSLIQTIFTTKQIFYNRKVKQQEEIEEQEIKELDNASKLLTDGYYSHSVLESFKAIQTHLYRELSKRDIRVQPYKFLDLIDTALKYKIISNDDKGIINDIRGMRNTAAHSNIEYTKQQAENALKYTKELIERNS